jgi:hypothetical protein
MNDCELPSSRNRAGEGKSAAGGSRAAAAAPRRALDTAPRRGLLGHATRAPTPRSRCWLCHMCVNMSQLAVWSGAVGARGRWQGRGSGQRRGGVWLPRGWGADRRRRGPRGGLKLGAPGRAGAAGVSGEARRGARGRAPRGQAGVQGRAGRWARGARGGGGGQGWGVWAAAGVQDAGPREGRGGAWCARAGVCGPAGSFLLVDGGAVR